MEYIDLGNQLEKDYLNLLTDKNVAFTQIRTHRKMVELADKEIQASEEETSSGVDYQPRTPRDSHFLYPGKTTAS